jgi:uncharacterized protein
MRARRGPDVEDMTRAPGVRATIIVIAKSPVPGRCKTRMCPPCSPEDAAIIAEASLADTLAAVAATPAKRRMLALDGPVGPWLPSGFDVVGQRGRGLGERLESAFEDAGGPALVIGMDTPQVTPACLQAALRALERPRYDAALGPACDGGFWALGLRARRRALFRGVPMGTDATYGAQLQRLESLGLRVALLQELCDVDLFADAVEVARSIPGSPFAQAVARVAARVGASAEKGVEARPASRC